MSYITTFTGKHFDPVHVDTDLIDLRDIATINKIFIPK